MYTELQVTSNFTFLRGGSHPEELVEQAASLGYKSIAITDRNTLAGIARAYKVAKGKSIRLIVGCRLDLRDGISLLAYPQNKAAYSRLCTLLSLGNLRTEKGDCELYKKDVYSHAEGLIFVAVPPDKLTRLYELKASYRADIREYKQQLGERFYVGITRSYQANDHKLCFRLNELAEAVKTPLVALNDVHYHEPSRRELQDVLTCVREKCTINNAGFRLNQNAERYLKPANEMQRIFLQYPDAIRRTQEIADACTFSLSELQYEYPEELTTDGRTPQEELSYLAWKGARDFYGETLPEKISNAIIYELKYIEEMNFAKYFLGVYIIVKAARDLNILCQGRGSAANSTICFVLGITSVDPTKFDLLFERFISPARNEPPDIDVDFEHERREEIIQFIYNKYGRDRAAIVATVTQVHQKGAIRDVAKAMGMSVDAINKLSNSIWEFTDEWFEGQRITSQGFDANDKQLKKVLDLTKQYMGFPRQLGQHTGGFVITGSKITDLCPILNARMENRTCIEWNKDDIDTLGFLKIDVLALGMLTCIRKAFSLAKDHYGFDFTLANIPQDDPAVYNMISAADTVGVFQIESRAQMSMLPRLKPQCFYDLVIEVAIVRPGPIQGDMVHPYLRRREGKELVEYPSKELEEILIRTLGVPLFQEQAMKIAIVAAGFTPAEADELRRAMATFKLKGLVTKFQEKLINGMLGNGYTLEFAQRIFKQLEGFGSYGFPESHAASFALLVYVSSWIKCYYPDVFAAALLNSMPMGFYQPAQIVIDAQKHGVKVLPVDVNYSEWDNNLEGMTWSFHNIRLGFRQVKGLKQEDMLLLLLAREEPFTSIHQIARAGVSIAGIERLADADAYRSIGLDRRQALWEVSALGDIAIGLFKGQADAGDGCKVNLPVMSLSEHVVHDYTSVSLSLKAHPLSFVREKLVMLQVKSTIGLNECNDGEIVRVAGLVLVRQRPGTAGGVCFITIEDETSFANLLVFVGLFERYRKEILYSGLLMVEGKVQREGTVTHVIVRRCFDLSFLLADLTATNDDNLPIQTLSRADEKDGYPYHTQDKRTQVRQNVAQTEIFPKGRNFK